MCERAFCYNGSRTGWQGQGVRRLWAENPRARSCLARVLVTAVEEQGPSSGHRSTILGVSAEAAAHPPDLLSTGSWHLQSGQSNPGPGDQHPVGPDTHQSVHTLGHRRATLQTDEGERQSRCVLSSDPCVRRVGCGGNGEPSVSSPVSPPLLL